MSRTEAMAQHDNQKQPTCKRRRSYTAVQYGAECSRQATETSHRAVRGGAGDGCGCHAFLSTRGPWTETWHRRGGCTGVAVTGCVAVASDSGVVLYGDRHPAPLARRAAARDQGRCPSVARRPRGWSRGSDARRSHAGTALEGRRRAAQALARGLRRLGEETCQGQRASAHNSCDSRRSIDLSELVTVDFGCIP